MCVCSRVFCAPLRHQPPTFFPLLQSCKFSCAHLESHNGCKSPADLCMFFDDSGAFSYRNDLEELVCRANYFTSTPSMSAYSHKHTGSRKALASFVV